MLTFQQLCELQDNWDGEGAPKPSQESISKAREIICWITNYKLINNDVDLDIDADVLGGVSLTLINNKKKKEVWISVLNGYNEVAVVFSRKNHKFVINLMPKQNPSFNWNCEITKNKIILFIRG